METVPARLQSRRLCAPCALCGEERGPLLPPPSAALVGSEGVGCSVQRTGGRRRSVEFSRIPFMPFATSGVQSAFATVRDAGPGRRIPACQVIRNCKLRPVRWRSMRNLHALPGSPIRPALRSDGHGVCRCAFAERSGSSQTPVQQLRALIPKVKPAPSWTAGDRKLRVDLTPLKF
jgi:hypothetical protein